MIKLDCVKSFTQDSFRTGSFSFIATSYQLRPVWNISNEFRNITQKIRSCTIVSGIPISNSIRVMVADK